MSGYKPICFQNEDGTFDGYDVTIIREGARRLNVEIDFVVFPWESLLTSLDADKCQVVSCTLWRTPERLTRYTMGTVPYFEQGAQLLIRSDSTGITDLASLAGKSVGTTVGDAWTTFLEDYNAENGNPLELRYYSEDIATVIQDIANGRIDATLNDPTVMYEKILALGLVDQVKLVGDLQGSGFCYIATQLSPAGIAIRDAFDEVYLEMIKDGTVKRICEEWFGTDYTKYLLDNIVIEN